MFRGYDAGGDCTIYHTEDTKISLVTTVITDLVLLVLMFVGVLRWKGDHQRNGIWWLLYKQVSLFIQSQLP